MFERLKLFGFTTYLQNWDDNYQKNQIDSDQKSVTFIKYGVSLPVNILTRFDTTL